MIRVLNKKVLIFISMLTISIVFLYVTGFRLSAQSAAKAHSFLEKNAVLIQTVDTKVGKSFIYKQSEYYLTIMPEKTLFLWRSSSSITTKDVNDKSDQVRTIGSESKSTKDGTVTVFVIEVKDEKVKYIEAGTEYNRERKEVQNSGRVTFIWDRPYFYHQINPVALSANGEILYKYELPIKNNFVDKKELRWHKKE